MNSRGVKPEDLDPERKRGTTLPTASDLSESTNTYPRPAKHGLKMNGFFLGLILGAVVATLAMYFFYRADIKALNDRWENAGRNSTTNAQIQLDIANQARKSAEDSLRKLRDLFAETKGERDQANARAEAATKKIDVVRRAARRKADESESDKAATLDSVRDALGD